MRVLARTVVRSEGVFEVLDGPFGQVELVWAGMGKEGLFGARVGECERR